MNLKQKFGLSNGIKVGSASLMSGDAAVPYFQLVKNTLGSKLLQYIPGSDLSGSVAADIGANAINGTYVDSVILGATGIGDGLTAVNFNEAGYLNDYSATLAALFSGEAGCLSWWANIGNVSHWSDGGANQFGQFGTGASYYYLARKSVDGYLQFISRRNATIKTIQTYTPTTARWFHNVFAWDASNIYAWVNGSPFPVTTSIGTWTGSLASGNANWGAAAGGGGIWPGPMGHMVIGNAVPTNAEAATISQSVGQIILEGDSRTAFVPWTSAAAELALPTGDFAFGKMGLAVYAVSGSRIAGTAPSLDARWATVNAIKRSSGKNVLVVWAGVNESAQAAADIYAHLQSYCTTARTAGWKVALLNEIDAVAAGWTAKYQALNALLAADHSFADGFGDLGACVELQDHTNLTYFTDGTHLTVAGNAIVRDVAYPAIAAAVAA